MDVQDFPQLHPRESISSRTLRRDSFQVVWDQVSSIMQNIMAEMNQPVFNHMHQFIMETRKSKQLRTGILYAGGVNSSEHSRTCSQLREYLQNQDCIVAGLNGRDLGSEKGSCQAAFGKICRIFVGPEAKCADVSSLMKYGQRFLGGESQVRKMAVAQR